MPHVRVLRPFNNGSHTTFVRPGEVLTVTPDRAADLARNGLVEAYGGEKAAPEAVNKMAPEPANKAEQPATVKRGPGRPPKVR